MAERRKETPSYYAVIPASIRYDNKLIPNAKLLFGEITALSNRDGICFAGNAYFAELYGVNTDTISSWVKSLKDRGHIKVQIIYKENSREIIGRHIMLGGPIAFLGDSPIAQKGERPTAFLGGDNTKEFLNTGEKGGRPGTVFDREGTTLVNEDLGIKLDETLTWLQGKKRLKHMPPQEWLMLFDELALNGIDLDEFRAFYEWVEALDWRSGVMSTKLLRGQVEAYINRDKVAKKESKGGKNAAAENNARQLERYR